MILFDMPTCGAARPKPLYRNMIRFILRINRLVLADISPTGSAICVSIGFGYWIIFTLLPFSSNGGGGGIRTPV